MTIYLGADHRGFALKNELLEYLRSKGMSAEDMGNHEYDALDDFPDFAQKVASAVQNNSGDLGIVICGSGIGVSIAANRFKGVRAALAFKPDQVLHGREHDHINVIAIPSDYVELPGAKLLVDAFLTGKPVMEEKYLRRSGKLDK